MVVDRHLVEFTKLNDVHGRGKHLFASIQIDCKLKATHAARCRRAWFGTVVAFVSSVDEIYKMRLTPEGMIALFFKTGKDDPFILKCRESEIVSQQIRSARGSGLVQKEAIHKALHLIQEIQAQERALEYQPSLERVNEISALYEKAAQQFVIGGDARSKEILEHKQKFLELPKVASIRKGTPQKPKAVPRKEPEILETSVEYSGDGILHQIESDDAFEKSWADFGKFDSQAKGDEYEVSKHQNVDDMLFEARQDFDAFNLGNEALGHGGTDRDGDENGDSFAFAEFDAMMEAAERELDEIRKM